MTDSNNCMTKIVLLEELLFEELRSSVLLFVC